MQRPITLSLVTVGVPQDFVLGPPL